jgi:purine nucleoside phosphorylase
LVADASLIPRSGTASAHLALAWSSQRLLLLYAEAWSPRLRWKLLEAASVEQIDVAEGVYVGLTGPTYETPAEVRMLADLGGDAVGMSTVLECIAARWAGLEVCGISLVTNAGAGYSGEPLTHEEVLAAGREAGPRMVRLVRRFVRDLDREGAGPTGAPAQESGPDAGPNLSEA